MFSTIHFTHLAFRSAAIAAVVTIFAAINPAAVAQDQRQSEQRQEQRQGGEPGKFDFYVLALSWSPSFCEAAKERSPERAPQQQCGDRPYHFVVHGLWPQHERGFPRDCQTPAPRLNRNIVSSMLDLMPSPRLVFNQWDRHGTCSGLGAQDYFEAVRKSYDTAKIPERFLNITNYLMVTPDEVEDAFVAANPGMSRAAIAVTCDTRRLSEVRICLTKDLRFRDCPEVDRRACRRDKIVMPPVRNSG
jgi:ribonuclease T2